MTVLTASIISGLIPTVAYPSLNSIPLLAHSAPAYPAAYIQMIPCSITGLDWEIRLALLNR